MYTTYTYITYVHSYANKVIGQKLQCEWKKKIKDALNYLPTVLKVNTQTKFQNTQESSALKTEVHNPEFREVQKQLFKRNKKQFYKIISVISSTLGEKKE